MFVEVNILLHAGGPCLLIWVYVHVCVCVCLSLGERRSGRLGSEGSLWGFTVLTVACFMELPLLPPPPLLILLPLSSSSSSFQPLEPQAPDTLQRTLSTPDPMPAVNPVTQYCCMCVCVSVCSFSTQHVLTAVKTQFIVSRLHSFMISLWSHHSSLSRGTTN